MGVRGQEGKEWGSRRGGSGWFSTKCPTRLRATRRTDTGYDGHSFQSRQCGYGVGFEGFLVLRKFIDERPLLFCAPQPLVSVSTLENPRRQGFHLAEKSTIALPTISARSQIFLAPT